MNPSPAMKAGAPVTVTGLIIMVLAYVLYMRQPDPISGPPCNLIVIAEQSPEQEEESIHIEVLQKNARGLDNSKQTEGTMTLNRASPRAEMTLRLPGSSHFQVRITSKTRLIRNGRTLTGTGDEGNCVVAVQGDTTVHYGVDASAAPAVYVSKGEGKFTYRPYLQATKPAGQPFADLKLPAEGDLVFTIGTAVVDGADVWADVDGVARYAVWETGTKQLRIPLAAGTHNVAVWSVYRGNDPNLAAFKNKTYSRFDPQQVTVSANSAKVIDLGVQ